MPTFSIIIPCYNIENFVESTVLSVLKQKYTKFELILVDDGSNDSTLEILKRIESTDHRVKVISKKNGGVSSARNIGIAHSSGDILYFLDGDDYITPNLLERAFYIYNYYKIDIFSFGYCLTKNQKITKKYSTDKYKNCIFSGHEFMKMFFLRRISQCMCSFFVSKELVQEYNIRFDENTKYGEDQEFQIKCCMQSKKLYYDSEIYFFYQQRDGSAINQRFIRDDFDVFFRLKNLVSTSELASEYDFYLCNIFLYSLKEAILKGSTKQTISALIKIDYVLRNTEPLQNKKIYIFSKIYEVLLKRYLIKKYDLKV